ncbi:hypothetical protein [Dyadobacter koreensis]|uniref:hypothetical protein n=1 Tax=Dyadobacter koreensis TaxID=408657 RepID=UPI000AD24916|nr:hypothetical protein [Dyadobacter koreensis]
MAKIGDPTDKRGLVFISHHPYISAFREEYTKPGEQIREILGESNRPVIWFWGHDHRLVVYNKAVNGKGPEAYGRCLGHGGLPVELQMPDSAADLEKIHLYDRRVRKELSGHLLGYNGFVMLKLSGGKLVAEYRDLEDSCVLEEEWVINTQNGQLDWNIKHVLPELAVR